MSTSEQNKSVMVSAIKVWFENRTIFVKLSDGRTVSAAVDSYPNLRKGTPAQWNAYELWNDGQWIHWEELDEDLSVEGFFNQDSEAA